MKFGALDVCMCIRMKPTFCDLVVTSMYIINKFETKSTLSVYYLALDLHLEWELANCFMMRTRLM